MNFSNNKILIALLLSFLFGIFVSPFFQTDSTVISALLVLSIITILAFRKEKQVVLTACCLIGLVLGMARYGAVLPINNSSQLQYYNNEFVTVTGVISADPDERETKTNIEVSVNKIIVDATEKEVSGKVLVYADKYDELKYGDMVEVTGKMEEPFETEEFSYKNYLQIYGIHSVIEKPKISLLEHDKAVLTVAVLYNLKHEFKKKINLVFNEPNAGLFSGIVLGDKKGLDEELTESFRRVGLSHIVVLSGFNITIIAIAIGWLLGFLMPKSRAFIAIIILISGFIILTGLQPPAVRAGIMGIIGLLALQIGRQKQALNLLIYAGFLMVLMNPFVLRFDPGFQLSVTATAGLILWGGIFIHVLRFLPKQLAEIVGFTLAAQLATLPLLVYYFGQVSIIAPLANILVVGLVPFAMLTGFLAVVFSFISINFGIIIGSIANFLLSYTIFIAEKLGELSWAAVALPKLSPTIIAFSYVFLYYVSYGLRKRIKIKEDGIIE